MNQNYVVCGTKGGSGKSIMATMVLPVLFADDGKKIKVFHLDDSNEYKLNSEHISFESIRMKDASTAIDEMEVAAIANSDCVNIIDGGAGDHTIELLRVIKKTQIKNLTYVIPILDDIEQVHNLTKTLEAIKSASPDANIYIVLNRVNDYSEHSVKEQFIGVFGSDKYGVDAYIDKADNKVTFFLMLRSSPLFSVLKNIYQKILLDAYHQSLDLLEGLEEKKKRWAKEGLDTFKKNNDRVRLAHDVNVLVADIQLQMDVLLREGDKIERN